MSSPTRAVIASLCLAIPALAGGQATAQTDQPVTLACRYNALVKNLTLDTARKTVIDESRIPNPGGSPDPVVGQDSYSDPAMQVSDQSVRWSRAIPAGSGGGPPVVFTLDRYTGTLHQTKGPGGIWPAGQDFSWTCERRQKLF